MENLELQKNESGIVHIVWLNKPIAMSHGHTVELDTEIATIWHDCPPELAAKLAAACAMYQALRNISQRVPIMGSVDEYRRGQVDTLEACRETAQAALTAADTLPDLAEEAAR